MSDEHFHDKIRWIDTSCMLVDCMTKSMNPKLLVQALDTSIIDLRPTAKSTELKNRKKSQRANKQAARIDDEMAFDD